jgi:hypothetical protein
MLNARMLVHTAYFLALAAALPTTGPDDDDFACYTSSVDYTSSSAQYEAEDHTTADVTYTQVYEGDMTDSNVPMTTLCDGRARALESYKIYYGTTTVTFEPPITNMRRAEYDGPRPTCTIDSTACPAIASAHPEDSYPCEMPVMEARGRLEARSGIACDTYPEECSIMAIGQRILYYWPVTTVSGDFCAQNGSTVFASPTSPPDPDKAVVDGYTFTSPTNYLSWAAVSAVLVDAHYRPHRCGPNGHTDVIVPITESFYSQGYKDTTSYSFNFADMNTVPVSAFNRQSKCGYEQPTCTMPIEGDFLPIVPVPTEIWNLEPVWKSAGCQGSAKGYEITPVALATPAPTAKSKLL